METAKNIFILIQALVGIIFSGFMMYSMFKVKKSAEKISDNATNMVKSMEYISEINFKNQKSVTPALEEIYKYKIVICQLSDGRIIWEQVCITEKEANICYEDIYRKKNHSNKTYSLQIIYMNETIRITTIGEL